MKLFTSERKVELYGCNAKLMLMLPAFLEFWRIPYLSPSTLQVLGDGAKTRKNASNPRIFLSTSLPFPLLSQLVRGIPFLLYVSCLARNSGEKSEEKNERPKTHVRPDRNEHKGKLAFRPIFPSTSKRSPKFEREKEVIFRRRRRISPELR